MTTPNLVYTQIPRQYSTGYAVRGRRREGKSTIHIRMHRVIMGLEPGDPVLVDHINGDRLDNRDENLRLATMSQNMRNRKINSVTITGAKGVSFSRGKWQAYVSLGSFLSLEDAKAARTYWAKIIHGEFFREE